MFGQIVIIIVITAVASAGLTVTINAAVPFVDSALRRGRMRRIVARNMECHIYGSQPHRSTPSGWRHHG